MAGISGFSFQSGYFVKKSFMVFMPGVFEAFV